MYWLRSLAVLICAATAQVTAVAAGKVFQDDFEASSAASPPPGWAMWGAEEFKVPANYIRDTNQAHTGHASFRIYHPGRTRGYIVSAPDRAIQPRAGMVYNVSFWARADKPGKALFQWIAYQSIKPFVDAPSPGSLNCSVDGEWREFTYSIREGLDFFADQTRFLLLAFNASAEPDRQQTLCIDDVRVTEALDPSPVVLLNAETITHEKLDHRLRPGEQLEFTLDVTKRLRRANADVGGVSFHRACGWTGQPYDRNGNYTLRPELETAIRDLRLPMTRFYGVGDEPFGVESSIDKVADLCRRVGVAEDHCVLEFEEQDAARKIAPEAWARGVRHAASKGYRFHYWEVANEPYSTLWGHGGAFPTPEAFISHFKAVSGAVREADAQAQIGMDIYPEHVRWGNYLLKQLAGQYDFVAPHYYCGADVHKLPFEDLTLTENYRMLDRALKMKALLRAYNGSRPVCQYDTEWGMISSTADGKDADYEDRNANIIGTVHRAVRLIYYAREDILRGASGWQMLSALNGQGFGILSQQAPEKRFMLYWLYYYFNRHLGESALQVDGSAPWYRSTRATAELEGPLTPVLASLSSDGHQVYLVIANGSWSRSVPCRVTLRNFRPTSATGIVITNNNLDGKPLLDRKEDAVSDFPIHTAADSADFIMPAHAVVFIMLASS